MSELCEEHAKLNTGEEQHCYHDRNGGSEKVCCWCGDLFIGDFDKGTRHGQYKPKSVKSFHTALKRLLRAQAAVDKVTDYSKFGGAATVELMKAVQAALKLLGR